MLGLNTTLIDPSNFWISLFQIVEWDYKDATMDQKEKEAHFAWEFGEGKRAVLPLCPPFLFAFRTDRKLTRQISMNY